MKIRVLLSILSVLWLSSQSLYAQDVKINEIMYNFGYNLNVLESGNWVELNNTTPAPIVMDGWQVIFGDDTFNVSSYTLMPGDYITVISKDTAFYETYPGVPYLGPTGFGLANDGNEPVRILDDSGVLVDEVIFDNNSPWPVGADGQGRSLALISLSLDNDNSASWINSGIMGGTPGASNVNPCASGVPEIVINEINYKSSTLSPVEDWVELYNPGMSAVDISGWRFLDSDIAYEVPQGTSIPADGYLVIASDIVAFSTIFPAVSNVILESSGIGLSGNGEQMALISDVGCLIDHVKYNDSAPWPLAPDGGGPTLTLVLSSENNNVAGNWTDSNAGSSASLGTPGMDNNVSDPCFITSADVIISEINYDSADSLANGGDWVELYNPNSFTVGIPFYSLLSSGDGFDIPIGTVIPANDYLVIAEDIAAFSAIYPSVTNVLGDSGVKFDNGGDLVSLYNGFGCLIDSVGFDNRTPWPSGAQGSGYTIEVLQLSSDDNDFGMNWSTSADSLGTPGMPNNAQPCVPPSNAPIVANITDNSANVYWGAGVGAIGYEVQYREISTSTWTTIQLGTFAAASFTTLIPCTDYVVRVRTLCANGGTSAYTTSIAFTTTGCFNCTASQNTFSFNITSNSAILAWDVLVGADLYTIYFKKASEPTFTSVSWVFPILVLYNIDPCEDYEWYVVNTCNGANSPPSGIGTFTTACKNGDFTQTISQSSENMLLYPNPAADILSIESVQAQMNAISILNMNGQMLKHISMSGEMKETIDVSDLDNGIYQIKIQTELGSSTEKLIIQR